MGQKLFLTKHYQNMHQNIYYENIHKPVMCNKVVVLNNCTVYKTVHACDAVIFGHNIHPIHNACSCQYVCYHTSTLKEYT